MPRPLLPFVRAAICFALGFLLASSAAAQTSDWPMRRATPAGDGYNASETTLSPSNAPTLRFSWSQSDAAPTLFYTSGPVSSEGVVVMGQSATGGARGGLYAYDTQTQVQIWFGITTNNTDSYVPVTAAIANGVVYAVADCWPCGAATPILYAFALHGCGSPSCAPLWTHVFVGDSMVQTPPVVADGVIYIETLVPHALRALSVVSHAVLWTAALPERSSGVVVADGFLVGTFPNYGVHVFAIGCRTDGGPCPESWSSPAATSFVMPSVSDGVAYVSAMDGSLYAFAIAGCGATGCDPLWSAAIGVGLGSPSVANGRIFAGYSDSPGSGRLQAISASTHQVVWTSTADQGFDGAPAIANGVVYVTSGANPATGRAAVYAFPVDCAAACDPIWRGPEQDRPGAELAVADGVLYATTSTGFDAFVADHASLEIAPNPIEFRDQRVKHRTAAEVTAGAVSVDLWNSGTTPITIGAITTALGKASEFSSKDLQACVRTLAVSEVCNITMLFKPTDYGDRRDTLQVYDDSGNLLQTAPLHGRGARGLIRISNPSISFADQRVGTLKPRELDSNARAVNLRNVGTVPVTITQVAMASGAGSEFFTRGNNDCTRKLDPNEICSFSLYFQPKAFGARVDTLQIFDEDHDTPTTATASGNGVAGTAVIEPGDIPFIDQPPLRQTKAEIEASAVTVQIRNASEVGVVVGQIGALTATDFTAKGYKACQRLLDPWEVCQFTMYFQPTAQGLRQDTLEASDDQGNVLSTALLHGNGVPPHVTLSTSTLAFGTTAIGAPLILPVVVVNDGTVPVEFAGNAFRVTGTAFGEVIGSDSCSGALAPGANCVVNVSFTPNRSGAAVGSLTLNDDADPAPQIVSLYGIGVKP